MQQFENPLFQVHALSALDSGRVLLHQIYNMIYYPSLLSCGTLFFHSSPSVNSWEHARLKTSAMRAKFYLETTEPNCCRQEPDHFIGPPASHIR
jgi:hypothetical protein